jgi:putative ABC transport system permease protein
MFWRLWWRAVSVKRSQAALALGALAVGAAITSMLLNLYGDVRRKMTEDFRSYGANVVIAPASGGSAEGTQNSSMLEEAALQPLAQFTRATPGTSFAPVLYGVIRVSPDPADPRLPEFTNGVAAGADLGALRRLNPGWREQGEAISADLPPAECAVGSNLAARLHVRPGDSIQLHRVFSAATPPNENARSALDCGGSTPPLSLSSFQSRSTRPSSSPSIQSGVEPPQFKVPSAQDCSKQQVAAYRVATVLTTGASEDDQVFVPLAALQSLLGTEGKVTLVEVSIPGETRDVESAVHRLGSLLPGLEVRPIRQIVYSEGKVLGTIRWLLLSLTILILLIIALCVMATMTAIVLERRKDIGVMKTLGAADALLMRLFMTEGASLGLVGGALGYAVGAVLARILGERLFGVALSLNAWTLPVVCALTVALAVFAAQVPVRIMRAIQPTVVLKGE